jgi:hypothetical protein
MDIVLYLYPYEDENPSVMCTSKSEIDDLKLSRKIDFTAVEQYLTRYILSLQEDHFTPTKQTSYSIRNDTL